MAKKPAAQESATVTDELLRLIELAATTAASKVYADGAGRADHYRAIEKLLYNYKRLETLVRNEEEYLTVESHDKSKSVVVFSPNGGAYRTVEEVAEEIARDRLLKYERTCSNFREVEQVINLFREIKEFIVIRMYYMGEDADGNERDPSAPRYTWEDIALELSARNMLKNEKTARRWRKNLINDMAVCMFGRAGAMTVGQCRHRNV
jgi:hypothetical protein